MQKFDSTLEHIFEDVLKAVTGQEVSVLSLGQELSVNVSGKQFLFAVNGDHAILATLPKRAN